MLETPHFLQFAKQSAQCCYWRYNNSTCCLLSATYGSPNRQLLSTSSNRSKRVEHLEHYPPYQYLGEHVFQNADRIESALAKTSCEYPFQHLRQKPNTNGRKVKVSCGGCGWFLCALRTAAVRYSIRLFSVFELEDSGLLHWRIECQGR